MTGTISQWTKKGYGFVKCPDLEVEAWLHAKFLADPHYVPSQGDTIEFTPERLPDGRYQARKAQLLIQVKKTDEQPPKQPEFIALVRLGKRTRLVVLKKDGTYRFSDELLSEHKHSLHIVTKERLELARRVEEFEALVNDHRTKENDIQRFFESNQEFILGVEHRRAVPHIVLQREDGDTLIPDFILEPVDQTRLADVLELKLPSAEIFVMKKGRRRFSAAVFEACAQLREYAEFFDEERNRRRVQEQYGLLAYRPRLFVIIGRRSDVDSLTVRRIEQGTPDVQVRAPE